MSVPERKARIETDGAELPVSTQAELLGLNRSGLHCKPVGPDEKDLKVKRMIGEPYAAHPEFGYRRMRVWLNKEKKTGNQSQGRLSAYEGNGDSGRLTGSFGEGRPGNHEQRPGQPFASPKYTGLFLEAGAQISMGHRGRAYDNIFVERLWRTVKYEDVYLKNYDRPADARKGLDEYPRYYNDRRYHSSLGYQTPSEMYFQP